MIIYCEICEKPAHGIFTKESDMKVIRCLEHKPESKITTAFKPINNHIKTNNDYNTTIII